MTLIFYRDYQGLFNNCIAYYNLTSHGIVDSALVNLANPGTYDGVITGATLTGTDRFGRANRSLYFGNNKKVAIASLDPVVSGNIYIMLWVNPYYAELESTDIVLSVKQSLDIRICCSGTETWVSLINSGDISHDYYFMGSLLSGWSCIAINISTNNIDFIGYSAGYSGYEEPEDASTTSHTDGIMIGNDFSTKYFGGPIGEIFFFNSWDTNIMKAIYGITKTKYLFPLNDGVRGAY